MIIAVTGTKGGTGKTTISTNIAIGLMQAEKSVCIIDTDEGQFSVLDWSSNRPDELPTLPVMKVPADKIGVMAREQAKHYDVVILDGRATQTEGTDRLSATADMIIVPVKPSEFDIRAFEKYFERYRTVKQISDDVGKKIEAYALRSDVKKGTRGEKELEELLEFMRTQNPGQLNVLKTTVYDREIYKQCGGYGTGVLEENNITAKKEMQELVNEVLHIINDF